MWEGMPFSFGADGCPGVVLPWHALSSESMNAPCTTSIRITESLDDVKACLAVLGYVISSAAKYGVDADLLSRGAGFGYIGSTIVSLIYASFTFIFFALEAAIMVPTMKAVGMAAVDKAFVMDCRRVGRLFSSPTTA